MSCWILGSCTHTFSLNYAGNCGGSPAGTERKTPEAEAHCAARIPCLSKGGLCCKALPGCPGLGLGPLKWEVNTFVQKSKDLKKPGSVKERLWCHVEVGLRWKGKLCFWVFPVNCLVRRLLGLRVGNSLDFSEGRSPQDHVFDSFKGHFWRHLWPHSSVATTGFRDVIGRILR